MDTTAATECLSDVLLTGASPLADLSLCPRLHELLQLATRHAGRRLWEEAGLALRRAYALLGAMPPARHHGEGGYLWSVGRHPVHVALQAARAPPHPYCD